MRTVTATDDDRHGYVVQRHAQSLLGLASGYANGGLAWNALYALLERGHTAEIRASAIRRLPAPAQAAAFDQANPHVITFMHDRTHGVIKHALRRKDLAHLCLEMALAYPTSRLGFVVPTEELAQYYYGAFASALCDVTLAFPRRCHNPGGRIAVATNYGLANREVICDPFDALVYVDAATAVGENAQIAMRASGKARVFGALRHDEQLAPRTADLIMSSFGPEQIDVPRLGHQGRDVHVEWLRISNHSRVGAASSPYDAYRRGIVLNGVRNQRITRLATALASGGEETLKSICPAASSALSGKAAATIIVAGNVEHAIQLKRRLPDSLLLTDAPANLTGLTPLQPAERPGLLWHIRSVIVTPAGLSRVDLADYNVLIWAAGGRGLPPLSIHQLACPTSSQPKPLLVVDLDDRHDRELHLAAQSRRRAYRRAGWPPVGTLPVVLRIRRYLAQRPRVKA